MFDSKNGDGDLDAFERWTATAGVAFLLTVALWGFTAVLALVTSARQIPRRLPSRAPVALWTPVLLLLLGYLLLLELPPPPPN